MEAAVHEEEWSSSLDRGSPVVVTVHEAILGKPSCDEASWDSSAATINKLELPAAEERLQGDEERPLSPGSPQSVLPKSPRNELKDPKSKLATPESTPEIDASCKEVVVPRKDTKDESSRRQLSQAYVSAAQTTKHHLSICLKLLGIMYQHYEERAEKECAESQGVEAVASRSGAAKEDKQYLAVVMLNSALLKAMHVAESFQAHCCRHFPELVICQQDDLISFDGTLTTIYEDEDSESKRSRREIPKEQSVSAEEHRRLQAQLLVANESSQTLEKQRQSDAHEMERLQKFVSQLKASLAEASEREKGSTVPPESASSAFHSASSQEVKGQSALAAMASAAIASKEKTRDTKNTEGGKVAPLESLGVVAERRSDGLVNISETELQRLVLIMQNLTRAVEEARASESEAKQRIEQVVTQHSKLQREKEEMQQVLVGSKFAGQEDLCGVLCQALAEQRPVPRPEPESSADRDRRPPANLGPGVSDVCQKEFQEIKARYLALQQKHQAIQFAYGKLKNKVQRDRDRTCRVGCDLSIESRLFDPPGRSKSAPKVGHLSDGDVKSRGTRAPGDDVRQERPRVAPEAFARPCFESSEEEPSDADVASVIHNTEATDEEGSSIEASMSDRGHSLFMEPAEQMQSINFMDAEVAPHRCPSAPDLRCREPVVLGDSFDRELRRRPERPVESRRRRLEGPRVVPVSSAPSAAVPTAVGGSCSVFDRRKVPFVVCSSAKSHHTAAHSRPSSRRLRPQMEYGAWLEGRQFAKVALRYAKNPGDTLALRELMGIIAHAAPRGDEAPDGAAQSSQSHARSPSPTGGLDYGAHMSHSAGIGSLRSPSPVRHAAPSPERWPPTTVVPPGSNLGTFAATQGRHDGSLVNSLSRHQRGGTHYGVSPMCHG